MDSGEKSFSEIVPGDRKFQIPRYQRDYSWDDSQLEDLWRDLETVHGTNKPHFMGTVLVRRSDIDGNETSRRRQTVYDIIDGQQRITTLQILLHVLFEQLRTYDDEEAGYYRSQYIENRDFKLSLKGDDSRFFQKQILGGREGVPATTLSPDGVAQERLAEAKEFFEDRFAEKEALLSQSEYESYLFELLDTIKDLEFMAYNVESASEAVRIFEATNDRGKQLTDLERTKSFLMYQLHLCYEEGAQELEQHLDDLRGEFKKMYKFRRTAAEEDSAPGEDRIQRYHFILWDDQNINVQNPPYSNHLSAIKTRFRGMDNDTDKVNEILGYVNGLRESFEALKELKTRDVDDTSLEKKIRDFFALNYEGNFYPLLFTAWTKFKAGEATHDNIETLLERIETYIFRGYVIKDYRTNKRKKTFYNLARDVHKGRKSLSEASKAIEEYIDQDCDDDAVLSKLRESNAYDGFWTQRLRYLLFYYDVSLTSRGEHLHLNFDETVLQEFEEQEISIEHIWPQDPDKLDLTEDELEEYHKHKHRLGNLALMIGGENSGVSNKPFSDKRGVYSESRIHMLNEVAEPEKRKEWGDAEWDLEEWGIEQIEQREEKLLSFILNRWPNYQTQGQIIKTES